jgi:hypothetical protein
MHTVGIMVEFSLLNRELSTKHLRQYNDDTNNPICIILGLSRFLEKGSALFFVLPFLFPVFRKANHDHSNQAA